MICDKCGICCKNLKLSDVYINLHNGDGICRYLDLETNLCTIYENRPILCNLIESYNKYFSEIYTEEEFYRLNFEVCEKLKRGEFIGK
ncbi:MAG: YkgJ family cysteine cluster protein [Cetobacterium somerae]|uniref:YkgJ family cysteine cluster protein n=1 Tax=Cetobacterium somerae TaxID=188913 RepID=UPI003891732F